MPQQNYKALPKSSIRAKTHKHVPSVVGKSKDGKKHPKASLLPHKRAQAIAITIKGILRGTTDRVSIIFIFLAVVRSCTSTQYINKTCIFASPMRLLIKPLTDYQFILQNQQTDQTLQPHFISLQNLLEMIHQVTSGSNISGPTSLTEDQVEAIIRTLSLSEEEARLLEAEISAGDLCPEDKVGGICLLVMNLR